jgi:glycosyltransferase involved in cell wall biosynthesis
VKAELENHPKYHNLRLIVIGDDLNAFPAVRHSVLRSGIQQSVRFLGFVPLETLRVFYDEAVAFLFPSLYEGFGLPPLEAMAHGTPVVTSNVSALPETVGDAAVLVNPENVFDIARGIREVLLDDEFREQLRQKGFQQVRRFSWDVTAQRVLEVYREVGLRQSAR